MTDVGKNFDKIKNIIKTDENYVPRNFQTIGGMWTVDTWKKGDMIFQLMDEGYTSVIRAPGLKVTDSAYRGIITFQEGGEELLNFYAREVRAMNDTEEMITITKKEYDELLDDSRLLNFLRNAGVDNWEFWDIVMDEYHKEE